MYGIVATGLATVASFVAFRVFAVVRGAYGILVTAVAFAVGVASRIQLQLHFRIVIPILTITPLTMLFFFHQFLVNKN